MYNKFTMELVWHNCKTHPPKELENDNLIVTNGNNVFGMSWHRAEGYFVLDDADHLKRLDDLDKWWWADIEQTVQSEIKFKKLKWNVYYYNINKQKVETYNIFDHGSFVKYVVEAIKEYNDKKLFAIKLKSELQYYFWSKAEWEIIISPWCGNKNPDEIKIDVFDQVMLNWDIFVDYVWENREKLRAEYEKER